jgi:hypothetical protein
MPDFVKISNEYEMRLHAIQYPAIEKRPTKSPAESYASFGARLDAYEEKRRAYNAAMADCGVTQKKITEDFKKAILAEYNIANHPKAEKLWEIAWSHGHASGLHEVAYWIDELAVLL